MSDGAPAQIFLTEDEVVERYRDAVTAGTLRNWRSKRLGPAWTKVGKSALYPLSALQAWEAVNTIRPAPGEVGLDG